MSFLLTYRLTVKLFTLFVENGLGQHAICFLKSYLGTLSRQVLSGPFACFHLERTVIQTNKQHNRPRKKNIRVFPFQGNTCILPSSDADITPFLESIYLPLLAARVDSLRRSLRCSLRWLEVIITSKRATWCFDHDDTIKECRWM